MYRVTKRMEISAAHNLDLPYDSPCNGLHGHNWIVTVTIVANALNKDGMIIDFSHVKKAVHGVIDHKYLNDILDFNTTAENMTLWVRDQVNGALNEWGPKDSTLAFCHAVEIFETEGNSATWQSNVNLEALFAGEIR